MLLTGNIIYSILKEMVAKNISQNHKLPNAKNRCVRNMQLQNLAYKTLKMSRM